MPQVRILSSRPLGIVKTQLSADYSIFLFIMIFLQQVGDTCCFLCYFSLYRQIFNCNTFSWFNNYIVTAEFVWNIKDTEKFVMNYNSLCFAFTAAFDIVDFYLFNKFFQQYWVYVFNFKKFFYFFSKFLLS